MDGSLRGKLDGTSTIDVALVAGAGTVRAAAGAPAADVELATEDGASAVAVRGGSAELVWNGRVVSVPSGHVVTYDETHAPGVPAALPGPPRLLAPDDGAAFRYRQSPPHVSFEWLSIEDTDGFRLQVARDAAFEQVVYDERLATSAFVHGNLGAGEYHWRVYPVRGPMLGPPSPARRIVVERDRVEPRLHVDVPSGTARTDRLTIRGTVEPGCRVVIGDRAIPVGEDGTFEHAYPLRPGYNFLVVQAIDPTGNTAFSNHTIVADFASPEAAP
jgi:hypothetical protein